MGISKGSNSSTEEPIVSPLRPTNVRIESEEDLLLVRLLMGAQPTLLIVAAAEAKIFDYLGEDELSGEDLAHIAKLDTRATRLVLDGLVGLGVLKKNGQKYSNTSASMTHLRQESDQSHAVRLWISGTRQWEQLPHILKTGRLPETNVEAEAWNNDSGENNAFIRSMYDIGWLAAQSVAESIDLAQVNHMIDLGGGPAHYTIAMLERSPDLQATLVDLPLTLMVAKDTLKRSGMDKRVELVACDLFKSDSDIPIQSRTTDLILISHLVHMEGPEQNAILIQKAAHLLRPGGKLYIHDMYLEEDRAHPQLSSLFAVHMLAMTQRGELYPASTMCGWLENAGLSPRVVSTSPFLVEGAKPGANEELVP